MSNTKKILLSLLGVGVAWYLFLKPKGALASIGITNLPDVLNKWKTNLDSKNLDAITNTYTKDAILVSTFGDILKGRDEIKNYFKGLFPKDNLKVEFTEAPIVSKLLDTDVYTGIYEFSYNENGKLVVVKARYSILAKKLNGIDYIIKQHSSEVPK